MFTDKVLICVETSAAKDKSVRANELGLKLLWFRFERRRKKSRGDEYEINKKDDVDDSKVIVENRLMLFGKWF